VFPEATVRNGYNVPMAGPVTLDFTEDVVGVDNTTVSFGRDGTWACTDASEAPTNCLTGAVRHASFTPASPFDNGAYYYLQLNPNHTLGLTDLAGNPFDQQWLPFKIHYDS
jgi:uncharacterized lipoprotein NlpE involved in copper resistance